MMSRFAMDKKKTKSRISIGLGGMVLLLTAACATQPTGGGSARKTSPSERVDLVSSAAVRSLASESCALPTKSQEFKTWLDRAGRCVQDKNWVLLEKLAQQMAQTYVDSPWGAYFLSVAAEARGDFARSLWMIGLAEKKSSPGNSSETSLFAYQRGRIYFDLKDTARAMSEIKKAISTEPRLVEGHVFLAEIYHRDQESESAIHHYKEALRVDPSHPRALAGLAELEPVRAPAQQERSVK